MPRIPDDIRSKLAAEHPGLRFIPIDADGDDAAAAGEPLYEFAFRKGTRADWQRYQQQQRDGVVGRSQGSVGIEATLYAQGRLVYPPANARSEWDELRESAPDVLQDVGYELLKEHSSGLKVRLGKP